MLVSDVDGTLLDENKNITPRARQGIEKIRARSARMTLISGRPPRGMSTIINTLAISEPVAALNGSLIVWPNLSILQAVTMDATTVSAVARVILEYGLELWLYTLTDWFVSDLHSPRVAHEISVAHGTPQLIPTHGPFPAGVAKVLGVSGDHPLVEKCEHAVLAQFVGKLSASRSQPHYLDITAPHADKGTGLQNLARLARVPLSQIAVIGDGPNDIPMFQLAGLSIAMGNAAADVQRHAGLVAPKNSADGFAAAVDEFILPRMNSVH